MLLPLPRSNQNPLALVADRYGVTEFGDITPELLRTIYKGREPDSRRLFWRVVDQLAFFGVVFRSPALRGKNLLNDWQESLYLWPLRARYSEVMRWGDDQRLNAKVLEYGLRLKGDTLGVPLKSLQSLVPGVSFLEESLAREGIELVDYRELLARTSGQRGEPDTQGGRKEGRTLDAEPTSVPTPESPSSIDREDVEFLVAGHEVVLPAAM